MTQFGHRVADRSQVGHRKQGGFRRDAFGDPDGPVTARSAGAVGHRDEGRTQRLQPPDGEPQRGLLRIVPGREELDREMGTRRG